ncbi:hypothetical protein AB0K09_23315 [Streptomyces sp. NPDC049577]|uniref:hypothetical protein n=1 Tax=Streptomyces sp. NPDC049577 TaxID=3155153 RepID=UPI003444F06E
MVVPVFQMFPDTAPLQLAYHATSGLVPFTVPDDASDMYLRLVALGPGCESLGGAAPSIEVRAGQGEIAAVLRDPGKGSVSDESGKQVATASWTREPNDIFLIHLEILDKNRRPWRLRITNNDPEELGFVWVASEEADSTRQPRAAMNTIINRTVLPSVAPEDITLTVANIGTASLTFSDPPGKDLGLGFTLKSLPSHIESNSCGTLVIGVSPFSAAPLTGGSHTRSATYVLACNDLDASDRTLSLSRYDKAGKESTKEKESKDKEKDGKDKEHKDTPLELMKAPVPTGSGFGGDEPGIADRLAELEQQVARLTHFIHQDLRPDLSQSAMAYENPAVDKQNEG